MRTLLDSNAYSHLKRGHRPVAELVRKSEEVFLSAIVAGELLYGFRQGSHFRTEFAGAPRFPR
jgi:predicted nucleic acid-binding protein